MTLEETLKAVGEPDQKAALLAKRRWDSVAKPLNSLGVLERDLIRIAAVRESADISLEGKAIVVMCADNGIVEEGVTQTGQEVTAIVAGHMGENASCVSLMASLAGARVIPVDVGMVNDAASPGVVQRKVARGTRNFLKEPAMTRAETIRALEVGIRTARELKAAGCQLAGSGEMGIGNTTTSSAVLSILLNRSPGEVTGRGAGLDTPSLRRKIQVIEEGIRLRHPDPGDGIDVLSKVGGLDLAGLAGLYIGCAYYRIPVVLDGVICAAAALAAQRICPRAGGFMLASHISAEPAGAMALEALGLEPAISAGLCLGEGTGAAALFPLLDMALKVYRTMSTFDEMKVEQYRPLG